MRISRENRRYKTAALALLVLLALAAVAAVSLYQQASSMSARNAQLEKQAAGLQADIGLRDAQIQALRLQISLLDGQTAALQVQNSELNAQVLRLQAQVAALQTQVAALQAQLAALRAANLVDAFTFQNSCFFGCTYTAGGPYANLGTNTAYAVIAEFKWYSGDGSVICATSHPFLDIPGQTVHELQQVSCSGGFGSAPAQYFTATWHWS